ncbi:two-component sensor histidine kinase [Nocardioides anomalus]|uniref:histidine kinase n=1 Tax=Nocardioides anomalus TaxID=2712223 RepID=A0A6G6W7X4_9ACTN|nr:histidine kinase [Nocardioides anomalus]QIG41441.1 two-component sensor histidine kinase [Nocardioides anomalus]
MPDPHDLWGERGRPRPRQVVFDGVVAGAFTLLALLPAGQQPVVLVVATLAMGLALLVRRVSWRAMCGLAAATGVLQLVAGQLDVLADLGYAAVFFMLGAHPRRGVRRFGLAAAAGSAVVLAVAVGVDGMDAVDGVSTPFAVVGSAAMAALVAGGGWAAGFVRWQNRARITAQVQAGLEQERTRMAADMHDLVAHTWAVVAAQADGARYSLGTPDGEQKAAAALDLIAETARGSIGDLRELLAELRYAPGTDLVTRMRASGMDLRLTQHGDPRAEHRGLLAEALTNALKHGDLSHPVHVEEDARQGYRLVVRNRRRSGSAAPGTGSGLVGMRERVERDGGHLTARPDGPDWVLRAEVS